MRIWFQGATDEQAHGPYLARLRPFIRSVLEPGTEFTFNTITPSVTTVHAVTEFRAARQFIRNAHLAGQQGFDAFAINHFQDAGLAEAKSMAELPVLGLGETTLFHALTLGRKIGLVTINPAFIAWHEEQLVRYGLQSRVAGVRAVDATIADWMEAFASPERFEALKPKWERECHALLAAGADVIVPAGGIPMMMFASAPGANLEGAPIVNGVAILAKAAENAVRLRRLGVAGASRRTTYALPPEKALREFMEDR